MRSSFEKALPQMPCSYFEMSQELGYPCWIDCCICFPRPEIRNQRIELSLETCNRPVQFGVLAFRIKETLDTDVLYVCIEWLGSFSMGPCERFIADEVACKTSLQELGNEVLSFSSHHSAQQ